MSIAAWKSNFRRPTPSTRCPALPHRLVSTQVDVAIQSPPDADTEAAEFKDVVCPPGVRVCAVRVIARRNWGVLGVGTELEGDGDKIDRPFRGGNNGGKFTKETFQLGEFEHLTGIEIHCSQSVVEAIRFEASTLGNVRKDRKDGMVSCCVRNLPESTPSTRSTPLTVRFHTGRG